ncbi:Eaa1 [Klebsiella pneumoniae]|nr:Eaa1 [Klebsiella pneumoniae]
MKIVGKTITRERLKEIAEDGFLKHGESKELASMVLAAMDSESWCLPLDYLQGHKDGLEWAAQLAEANHPETGDWLYDDPIELAKAIRKGPDMPPVQPVADSEPVAWTWHYREQWHVTNDERRASFVAKDGDVAVLPLYRHAQPVPVVSADLLHSAASAIEDLLTTKDRTGAGVWFDLPFKLRSAANAQPVPERDQVRSEHAEWSQATFGNVGPVGPLKHLSKEALEAAEQPGDLSEWADMQFLLWDAQRRAGITDEQITQAMIEKLAVNKQREWPEPKDGEPRLHIKEQPAPLVPDELLKEYLRLVQCMLSDYRDGNYGDAQRWIRHIAKASDDFERKYGLSPWEMARKTCRAAMLNGGKP